MERGNAILLKRLKAEKSVAKDIIAKMEEEVSSIEDEIKRIESEEYDKVQGKLF